MPIIVISGSHAKGKATSDNEEDTQRFVAQKREDGAIVSIRRKYETFLGGRLEVNPKQHVITWSF